MWVKSGEPSPATLEKNVLIARIARQYSTMTTGDSDSASSPGSTSETVSSQKSRNGRSSHRKQKDSTTKIIQVVNIAPQAKREEIQTLFAYLGKIDDLRLYPTLDIGMTVPSKICFIKFYDANSVGTSQHLTNTVFIDRALIVVPYMESEIPDEQKGMELLNSGSLLPGIADPKLPQHVTSQLEGFQPNQYVATHDPKLLELELPSYPRLLPTLDARKIEEIRRTVMIANLDPELTSEEVVDHFNQAGEVKYFRFCTRDNDPLHYGLLEFSEQPSILEALKMNGTQFGSKIIKVFHATQSILKPQAKSNEAAQKEIEDALSRQTFLSGPIESSTSTQHMGIRPDKRRSRSRDRRRSRSRDRRRSRSRSKKRSRSRSKRRSRSRDKHSRSKKKSRSRSRDRRRSRSKKRSKSPSRHRKRSRSRSRSKERSKKKDKKDKDRKEKEHRKEKENGIKKEEAKA